MRYGNGPLDRLTSLAPEIVGDIELRHVAVGDDVGPARRADDEVVAFPIGALVSLLVVADGDEAELTVVGRDGCVDARRLTWLVSQPPSIARAVVPGMLLAVPLATIARAMEREPEARALFEHEAARIVASTERQVLCRAVHTVDRRVATWLLVAADRLGTDAFPLTQTVLASSLGVRRASVNKAQRALSNARIISYRRGSLRIDDVDRLRAVACGCAAAVSPGQASGATTLTALPTR